MSDSLIIVEDVSKKFCRRLRRSLWYGLKDIGSELFGGNANKRRELREGEFWAVRDVSFELKRGDTIGLIGRNGAGKTTLLRMLNGLIKPDGGRIEIRGRMQALIALGAGFNPILTGRENIYVNAAVLGIPKAEVDRRFDEIVGFSGVERFINTPVQNYSSGMVVRLGFAVAANMNPDILLVDEILAVGDIGFQSKCFNKIGELRRKGVATVLVSHSMMHILGFCEKVLYLEEGRSKYLGESESAVTKYREDMKENVSSNVSSFEFGLGDAHGTGRVLIRRIAVLNDDESPVDRIHALERVTFRIFYTAYEDIGDAELDVAIRARGSDIFFRASSKAYGVNMKVMKGSGHVDVGFDGLRANSQTLMFYFTMWRSDRTELFDWKRELPLYVEGDSRSGGNVLIDIRWQNHQDPKTDSGSIYEHSE